MTDPLVIAKVEIPDELPIYLLVTDWDEIVGYQVWPGEDDTWIVDDESTRVTRPDAKVKPVELVSRVESRRI